MLKWRRFTVDIHCLRIRNNQFIFSILVSSMNQMYSIMYSFELLYSYLYRLYKIYMLFRAEWVNERFDESWVLMSVIRNVPTETAVIAVTPFFENISVHLDSWCIHSEVTLRKAFRREELRPSCQVIRTSWHLSTPIYNYFTRRSFLYLVYYFFFIRDGNITWILCNVEMRMRRPRE